MFNSVEPPSYLLPNGERLVDKVPLKYYIKQGTCHQYLQQVAGTSTIV